MSGTHDFDDPEPFDEAAYQVAGERYGAHLAALDLSRAGDLLLYFGRDFFHDAGIRRLELSRGGRDVVLGLQAWLEGPEDLPDSFDFEVCFHEVAWQMLERSDDREGLDTFLYSEIDGLHERLAGASEHLGGEFHSIAIECVDGWVALVFRSVRVSPYDPVLWARLIRDARIRLPLYGLD